MLYAVTNTGRCVDERDGFRCVCAPGYSGSRCDVDVDDCQNLRGPCLNDGVCVDGLDMFSCRCPSGYSGSVCQFRDAVDRCLESDCADNAVSVVRDAASLTSAVDCRSSPCMNGATCVDVGHGRSRFRCICKRQFRGRRCNVEVVKRRHSKYDRSSSTTVISTFNISTTSSRSVSSTEHASGVNSGRNLIVVMTPVTPFVIIVVAAVVVAVALTGSTAFCICWHRRLRRRHRNMVDGCRSHHHAVNAAAEWIHNDVRRQKNNISNCKNVAKFHRENDML